MGFLCRGDKKKMKQKEMFRWQKRLGSQLINKVILYSLLILIAVPMAMPFVWMVSTSLKPDSQVFLFPPKWIPSPIMWSNYAEAVRQGSFFLYLKNSLFIAFFCVGGTVLTGSLGAYAFARLRWPGRDWIFLIVISTLMIPWIVTMVPTYILFKYLHGIDTFYPLIVPAFFGGNAFFIFLMRQFFKTLPSELEDAALLDGASYLQIYYRLILPLSKPVLATVAIFSFLAAWNDFLSPLIYLNDPSKYTLQLGLEVFKQDFMTNWTGLMSMSTLIILPCLVIFFFAQRYFIRGIVLTGITG